MGKYKEVLPIETYIVEYNEGDNPETYREHQVFVTHNKETAEEYVKRFNDLLKKLKEHYYQRDILRWDDVSRVNECVYYKIELR